MDWEVKKQLSVDMIIAKFIPILWALLFTIGFWYLIYTSVWEAMAVEFRLWLGFFASFVMIGTALSLSHKIKYFADILIWSWILLWYGTLLYGSRSTELAAAVIPEQATLFTAFIFTLWISYFASLRKSKVILILGILWAYLTPFVIGQNDIWSSNVSFNAYLIYFAAVNVSILILARDLPVHQVIPVNLLWLFLATLWLTSLDVQTSTSISWFFSSDSFSLVLLTILLISSTMSIIYSAKYFSSKEDIWLSAWYLIPLFWFMIVVSNLWDISLAVELISYICIASAFFGAWYMLWEKLPSRNQHAALYVGGIIAIINILSLIFPELNFYLSLLIAYGSLIFLTLYMFHDPKSERLISAGLFSFFWWLFALSYLYENNSDIKIFQSFWAALALVPSMVLGLVVRFVWKESKEVQSLTDVYSIFAAIIAALLVGIDIITNLDFFFMIFILPWVTMILLAKYRTTLPAKKSSLMRFWVMWMSIGFFPTFFYLLAALVPHAADSISFIKNGWLLTNWEFIKSVCTIWGYFAALGISRSLQKLQEIAPEQFSIEGESLPERPSFLLVVCWYTVLLLVWNLVLVTLFNDLGAANTIWWVRAIATTFWWISLALFLLFFGIQRWQIYQSEKLLGLLLLFLTVWKIALYDLAAMDMNKKIIVLMVVGGLMMMFSYFLQSKWYLSKEFEDSSEW